MIALHIMAENPSFMADAAAFAAGGRLIATEGLPVNCFPLFMMTAVGSPYARVSA